MDKPIKGNEFVKLLKAELRNRAKKNPSYSLRSFAKYLGISSSYLSKILNETRPLTNRMQLRFSETLGLSPKIMESLIADNALNKQSLFNFISEGEFEVISEWYHFAILELVEIRKFKEDPAWIGKRLGIDQHLAAEALDRLMRLHFLKRNSRDRITLSRANNTTLGAKLSCSAHQLQQTQFLHKAIDAMKLTPIEKRSQTSLTIAIPQNKLPLATEMINNFRREFNRVMSDSVSKDEVYQLVLSFFPLTKTIQKGEMI